MKESDKKKSMPIRESKPSKLADEEVVHLYKEKNPWRMNASNIVFRY